MVKKIGLKVLLVCLALVFVITSVGCNKTRVEEFSEYEEYSDVDTSSEDDASSDEATSSGDETSVSQGSTSSQNKPQSSTSSSNKKTSLSRDEVMKNMPAKLKNTTVTYMY